LKRGRRRPRRAPEIPPQSAPVAAPPIAVVRRGPGRPRKHPALRPAALFLSLLVQSFRLSSCRSFHQGTAQLTLDRVKEAEGRLQNVTERLQPWRIANPPGARHRRGLIDGGGHPDSTPCAKDVHRTSLWDGCNVLGTSRF